MSPQILLLLLVLLTAMLFFSRYLVNANPAHLALAIRVVGGWSAVAFGIFALFRGLFLPGMIALGIGTMALRGGRSWGGQRWRKSAQQSSHVRSSVLSMELDHDTGEMDGEVLTGDLSGKRLKDLSLEELQQLYQTCLEAEDQSLRLLEAFLDRHHEGWREKMQYEEHTDASGEGGLMTVDEAYAILGLPHGADAGAIKKAHRKLMRQFHPDMGGSDYLAGKINQAKDLLLDGMN